MRDLRFLKTFVYIAAAFSNTLPHSTVLVIIVDVSEKLVHDQSDGTVAYWLQFLIFGDCLFDVDGASTFFQNVRRWVRRHTQKPSRVPASRLTYG
jgi:hypothetical protein